MPPPGPIVPDVAPPPIGITSLDELIERLRATREWAGSPSYAQIARRIEADRAARGAHPGAQRVSRATVYDCFRTGRSRLDVELLVEVVRALGVPDAEAAMWRRAYGVAAGAAPSTTLVEVRDDIPPPDPHFTGRAAVVAALAAQPSGSTAVLVGMPGVGKTQLALRAAAHLDAERSRPRLFVALRGSDPDHAPPDVDVVLDELLTRAGVASAELRQLDTASRVRRWASWLDDASAVVILDDAGEIPFDVLVPRRHGAHVIITGRRRPDPGQLPAGATVVEVEPLGTDEAIELLVRIVGPSIADDIGSATRLVEICGHLPLEVTVAASHVASTTDWSVSDHVRRLEALPPGELVRPALVASTRRLTSDEQRLFRRLALHPGHTISLWAATALSGGTEDATASIIAELVAVHLARPLDHDGIVLHDLVREHATTLLYDAEPHREQRAAVERLLDRAIELADQHVATVSSASHSGGDETAASFEWLDRERTTLVRLADVAVRHDLADHAGRLSLTLSPYLELLGHRSEAAHVHQMGLAATDADVRGSVHRDVARAYESQGQFLDAIRHLHLAIETAPDPLPGRTHNLLGNVYRGLGRFDDAMRHHELAHDEALRAGDDARRGRALNNIGNVRRLSGDFVGAESALREALAVAERAGDITNVVFVHANLGTLYESMGRLAEAEAELDVSIATAERNGSTLAIAANLAILGNVRRRRGDHPEAVATYRRGIDLAAATNDAIAEGECRVGLGRALVSSGRPDEALDILDAAVTTARRTGAVLVEIEALNALGEAALAFGDVASATEHHRAAIVRATSAGDLLELGRGHSGLGAVAHAAGDRHTAVECWQTALELLDRLGSPDADAARRLLDAADAPYRAG